MSEPINRGSPYRFRLLLSELLRQAERTGDQAAVSEIEALRRAFDADPEPKPELVERLGVLAERFGRALEPEPPPARWLSFLKFSGPALLVLVFLGVLIERRRRRQREVSEAALARLDAESATE